MTQLHTPTAEPEPQLRVANIGPGDLSTNELRRMPLLCGEAKTPVLWCGNIYNQFTRDTPAEKPSKK